MSRENKSVRVYQMGKHLNVGREIILLSFNHYLHLVDAIIF